MSFVPGDYKQSCPRCGFTVYASTMAYEAHTGERVCPRCIDEYQPSPTDAVGRDDTGMVDGARPRDPEVFLDITDNGRSQI